MLPSPPGPQSPSFGTDYITVGLAFTQARGHLSASMFRDLASGSPLRAWLTILDAERALAVLAAGGRPVWNHIQTTARPHRSTLGRHRNPLGVSSFCVLL